MSFKNIDIAGFILIIISTFTPLIGTELAVLGLAVIVYNVGNKLTKK